MVYLNYIACLRYAILVWNPRFYVNDEVMTHNKAEWALVYILSLLATSVFFPLPDLVNINCCFYLFFVHFLKSTSAVLMCISTVPVEVLLVLNQTVLFACFFFDLEYWFLILLDIPVKVFPVHLWDHLEFIYLWAVFLYIAVDCVGDLWASHSMGCQWCLKIAKVITQVEF